MPSRHKLSVFLYKMRCAELPPLGLLTCDRGLESRLAQDLFHGFSATYLFSLVSPSVRDALMAQLKGNNTAFTTYILPMALCIHTYYQINDSSVQLVKSLLSLTW